MLTISKNGGGNLANQNKKKGFAISGIMYPLLILTLFLVVQILMMMQTRKNVLDKVRTELAESVNSSNKIYSNEELSILVDEINSNFLNKTYPVGSIYISYTSTNPKSIFGGTWTAFGTGRTLVGIDTGNTNFNSLGKTGGSSSQSIKLTTANLPGHTHSIPALSGSTNTTGAHTHNIRSESSQNPLFGWSQGNGLTRSEASYTQDIGFTMSSGNHSHTVTTNASTTGSTGSATAFSVNTQNPYITVYMWRRTA